EHDEGQERRQQRQGNGGKTKRSRDPSRRRRRGSSDKFGGGGFADVHRLISSQTGTRRGGKIRASGSPPWTDGREALMLLYNNVSELRQFRGAQGRAVANRHHQKQRAGRQLLLRKTWISRSRIFLRSVLRLTPSKSAARIWLPRVAASVADR